MSPQPTLVSSSHKCLFCLFSNSSWAKFCADCPGATIPTRDLKGAKLDYLVYSFGSGFEQSERSSLHRFSEAMEILSRQKGVAIRFHDDNLTFILVRHIGEAGSDGQDGDQGAAYSLMVRLGKVVTSTGDPALYNKVVLDLVYESWDHREELKMAGDPLKRTPTCWFLNGQDQE